MPREDDVGPGEDAVPEHEGLPDELLLGRGAEDADRPRELSGDPDMIRRDGGRHGRRTEEVVPAAVPRGARDAWRLRCFALLLRQAGERVVLGEDSDDGGAEPALATKAVGIPATPRVTVNPSFSRTSSRSAADFVSASAVSE